jgi:hypothetical protein
MTKEKFFPVVCPSCSVPLPLSVSGHSREVSEDTIRELAFAASNLAVSEEDPSKKLCACGKACLTFYYRVGVYEDSSFCCPVCLRARSVRGILPAFVVQLKINAKYQKWIDSIRKSGSQEPSGSGGLLF